MIKVREKVKDFLRKYSMEYESRDMEQGLRDFIEEMERGLKGDDSSLKMLPTYIAMSKEIPLEEPVIVMDAGGTNFRVAVVYFDKCKKPVIEDYKLYSMPGAGREISEQEFFETIAGYIEPVLNRSKKSDSAFPTLQKYLPTRTGGCLSSAKRSG